MNKVDQYIEKKSAWKAELEFLRNIMLETQMEETVKWGVPTYTLEGKNVVGIAAFKNYVGLWFFNGVFLKDKAGILINAQEDKTKGLRQWRFKELNEMDARLIKAYTLEAIENQKEGKEIKPEKRIFDVPEELKKALNDKTLNSQFQRLSPGKQKEYYEFIGSAKQAKTRASRLEKSIAMIKEGKGLNDKYR